MHQNYGCEGSKVKTAFLSIILGMFDDFEEKFDPLKDVKPKEEPADTIVTPCHSSDTLQNCIETINDERNFCLNTEIKIEPCDTLSSGNDNDPLKTNQCKKEAFVSLTRLSEATIAKYVTQKMSVDMTVGSSFIEKQELEDNSDEESVDPLSLANEHNNIQYNCTKCDKRFEIIEMNVKRALSTRKGFIRKSPIQL